MWVTYLTLLNLFITRLANAHGVTDGKHSYSVFSSIVP
jgi:hypothetical protein